MSTGIGAVFRNLETIMLHAVVLSLALSCGGETAAPAETPTVKETKTALSTGEAQAAPAAAAGQPVQEPLIGGPFPTLILGKAWFTKVDGKPKPGAARLVIWRKTDTGWQSTRLEDGDSNVFHKAILRDDGSILTIAGDKAALKRWTHKDGKWNGETLWTKSWGGRFNRMRDLEVGDVNGDGKDEYVIATHDFGVVAVYNPADGSVIELDQKADTFVHEIEIGDIDGDGKNEFFATPSGRNKAGTSQKGSIVMYQWDGSTYKKTNVDPGEHTHAKEILVTDVDGDGTDEFYGVLEAELGADKSIVKPVEIRQYHLKGGAFTHTTVATIQDRQTRFLVPGDFDGDGHQELVAAAMKTGLYLLDWDGKTWNASNFDSNSGGFEHAATAHDLDGDGTPELYVAADDQKELKQYKWSAAKNTFERTKIGAIEKMTLTWYIEAGTL